MSDPLPTPEKRLNPITPEHEALTLCKEWHESEEGRSLASIIEIEDKANAVGKKVWNEDFIAMCRAIQAALSVASETAPHVAWCRYVPNSEPTQIELCDSDTQGAFKVYRALPSAALTNTPGGLNRDVSAGTSHSEPDGSATKPAISSSQDGASQGAAPILSPDKPNETKAAPMPTTDDLESALRMEYGGTATSDALINLWMRDRREFESTRSATRVSAEDRMEDRSLLLELCHQLGAEDGENMHEMMFDAVRDALRYRWLRSGERVTETLGAAQVVGEALDHACDKGLSYVSKP